MPTMSGHLRLTAHPERLALQEYEDIVKRGSKGRANSSVCIEGPAGIAITAGAGPLIQQRLEVFAIICEEGMRHTSAYFWHIAVKM